MQCSGGILLLGGGNLPRSNFDHSENCYLVRGGDEPLVGGGKQTFCRGGVYWGGFFLVGEGMSKFSASGGDSSHPPSRENPGIGDTQ